MKPANHGIFGLDSKEPLEPTEIAEAARLSFQRRDFL